MRENHFPCERSFSPIVFLFGIFSSYPGFNDKQKMIAHAANLTASLQRDQVPFDTSYYYVAGYDAPYKVLNRHNEIWVIERPGEKSKGY